VRLRIHGSLLTLPVVPGARPALLAFSVSLFFVYILKPAALFPRGCRQPLSSSLDSDRRPFAFRPRGRKGAPLVFYVEAAARASSPTLFWQIAWKSSLLASYMQLTNYINGDLSAKRVIVKRTGSLPHHRSATRDIVVISTRTSGSLFRFLLRNLSIRRIPRNVAGTAIVGIRLNSPP